jgi:DnaJ-class molecular chaperone
MRNHYDVLGVHRTAGAETIRQAYQALRTVFDPDRYRVPRHRARAEAHLRAIEKAYRILADPETRRRFDQQRPRRQPRLLRRGPKWLLRIGFKRRQR